MSNPAVIKDRRKMLRIKFMSLAAEARIIRKEEKHTRNNTLREELYLHRIKVVRKHARDTHIAYALLRGRTYAQVEPKAYTDPDWPSIVSMLKKYGPKGIDHSHYMEVPDKYRPKS